MHRTVLLLMVIAAIRCAWGLFVGSRFSVEIAAALAIAAVTYAVWRYVRHTDPAARRSSN